MFKKSPFSSLLAGGVVLWVISIPLVLLFFPPPDNVADFGDMFGAVNALFSGLALAGVTYAVVIQRDELSLTRDELAKTAAAQIEAAQALQRQIGLQQKASRLTALSALVASSNEQINQHDRWNEVRRQQGQDRKFDNAEVLEKRRRCESEIWTILEEMKVSAAADSYAAHTVQPAHVSPAPSRQAASRTTTAI
ncbi:MAG TPA: hypothetical protein VEC35_24915 [Noviherbaspirillum sp.]|nr:hypothetical protein [Noviherbaspirillum sp.]